MCVCVCVCVVYIDANIRCFWRNILQVVVKLR